MSFAVHRAARRAAAGALAIAASGLAPIVIGCGGGDQPSAFTSVGLGETQAATALGIPTIATNNTSRIAGADPVADAAGVARAVYPSVSPQTRPRGAALVDAGNWEAALAASELMSPPLHAPVLYSLGEQLPPASAGALGSLTPTGIGELGGAQVVEIGRTPALSGYRTYRLSDADPFALAGRVAALVAHARGTPDRSAMIVSADSKAFAMPAAGYAAEAGVPILFATRLHLPHATRAALEAMNHPHIYVLGPPSVIDARVMRGLARLGSAVRIEGPDPIGNAIAFARFTDRSFGWNVNQPGHGLVFVNSARPLDAPVAAAFSASGEFGPLLLTRAANSLPEPLIGYLLDIQPGYEPGIAGHEAVDESYNRGWLIGDARAFSLSVQAQLDSLLEIQPIPGSPPGNAQ